MQCSSLCIKANCGLHLVWFVFAKRTNQQYIVCFVLLLMLPGWLHLDLFCCVVLSVPLLDYIWCAALTMTLSTDLMQH